MAIESKSLTRVFFYNGVRLADPGPSMSLEQVKGAYSPIYFEITNASVEGPNKVGDELHYTFKRVVRDKGAS